MSDFDSFQAFCSTSGKAVVAVVIDMPRNLETLTHLATRLTDSPVQPAIIAYDPDILANVDPDIPSFHIPSEDFVRMDKVAVCVAHDRTDLRFPLSARVVILPHAFFVPSRTAAPGAEAFGFYDRTLVLADALFLPQPAVAEFTPEQYREALSGRYPDCFPEREGPFTIIPGGYLKADLLARKMAAQQPPRTSVLILQSSTTYANGRDLDEDMIEAALEVVGDTDDLTVTFRPYPGDPERRKARRLEAKYAAHPRFIFDHAPSTVPGFTAARTLVTVHSLGRITFTVATGLPHVVYSPTDGDMLPTESGYEAHDKTQLADSLRRILDEVEADIDPDRYRKKMVLNPGRAYAMLIDSIIALARGETRDEWIRFDRELVQGDWDDADAWLDLLDSNRIGDTKFFIANALERFPGDTRFTESVIRFTQGVRIDYQQQTASPLSVRERRAFFASPETLPTYPIWGCSQNYHDYYSRLVHQSPARFLGFFDSNPQLWGTRIDGFEVCNPEEMTACAPAVIFIASWAVPQILSAIGDLLSKG